MNVFLDWIGGGRLQQVQASLDSARAELQQVRANFDRAQEELKKLRSQLQFFTKFPPAPTDAQLVDQLSTLGKRVIGCIERLEESRVMSAGPLQRAAEVEEQAATVSKQERFSKYVASLKEANIQISLDINHLMAVHSPISILTELLRSGHLDPGHPSIRAIDAVLKALKEEPADDDSRGVLYSSNNEGEWQRKGDDRNRDLERRQREKDRTAAAIAFSKHKLPPLTPFEKFRALKSGGQRDGFG